MDTIYMNNDDHKFCLVTNFLVAKQNQTKFVRREKTQTNEKCFSTYWIENRLSFSENGTTTYRFVNQSFLRFHWRLISIFLMNFKMLF